MLDPTKYSSQILKKVIGDWKNIPSDSIKVEGGYLLKSLKNDAINYSIEVDREIFAYPFGLCSCMSEKDQKELCYNIYINKIVREKNKRQAEKLISEAEKFLAANINPQANI